MRRSIILLAGSAAAAGAALLAAAALRLDDGSFTPKAPMKFVRRAGGDLAAPGPAPRSGSLPDYVVGTDKLARDRQILEEPDPSEASAPAPAAGDAEPPPEPGTEPAAEAQPPD